MAERPLISLRRPLIEGCLQFRNVFLHNFCTTFTNVEMLPKIMKL